VPEAARKSRPFPESLLKSSMEAWWAWFCIHHCMEETSDALPREFRDLIKEFQGFTKYL
jgi:hypothetical protein